jgi:hypothetical protein
MFQKSEKREKKFFKLENYEKILVPYILFSCATKILFGCRKALQGISWFMS